MLLTGLCIKLQIKNSVEKVWEHASLESHGFRVEIQEKMSDGEYERVSIHLYREFPDVLTTKETNIDVGIPRP